MIWRRAFERTLLEILGTRELLMLAVVSVLFYAFYYPAPYSQQQVIALPIAVVDQDDSAVSRALVTSLAETHAVRVAARTPDLAQAERMLRDREVDGILLFSRDLTSAARTFHPGAGVALIVNGAYFVRAEGIARTLGDIVGDRLEELSTKIDPAIRRSAAVPIRVQPLFNTTDGYRDYVFPAIANIILQQTLLFTCARLIAERRRRGGWHERAPAALGTLAACVVIGMLAQFFVFGFAFWIQDVPRGGNIPGLLIAVPIFATAVSSMGLAIGSFFRNGDDALKLLMPTSVPLVFLAGFAWPLNEMPGWLSTLAWLSPATAAMHLFIRFNQMQASLREASGPLIIITCLALVGTLAWLARASRQNLPRSTA